MVEAIERQVREARAGGFDIDAEAGEDELSEGTTLTAILDGAAGGGRR